MNAREWLKANKRRFESDDSAAGIIYQMDWCAAMTAFAAEAVAAERERCKKVITDEPYMPQEFIDLVDKHIAPNVSCGDGFVTSNPAWEELGQCMFFAAKRMAITAIRARGEKGEKNA